jgi:hypothetical protein
VGVSRRSTSSAPKRRRCGRRHDRDRRARRRQVQQKTGVAFSLDADAFVAFARSLLGEIHGPSGQPLETGDIVDFNMCWANQYEINCDDYERIKTDAHHGGPRRSGALLAA